MRLRLFSCIFVLSAVLSACQPAGGPLAGNPTGGKAAQYQSVFNAQDDPASATVKLDETRAVEAVIPPEGGRLSAAGADGARYELEIPADALLVETKIRIIPAAVSGLPFGGEQTYAAQLEPEGLFMNNFATLTITPPTEIPLKEQLFFGYQETGKEVIFAPPDVGSRDIRIRVLHFSGYGVTKGLLAETDAVRERLGGSAERRLQSQTAELLGSERQRQLLNGDEVDVSELGARLQELFDRYEREVVAPRVAAAGESCAAGRLAIQTVLGNERQKQLLGMGEGGMDKVVALMDTVSRVCLQEEYELCAEDHVIHRMIPVWLGFERQYQLLGAAAEPAHAEVIQYARDLVKKCLTFELVFESQAIFDDGGGGGFESAVRAKVPLHFQIESLKIEGSSALVNNAFTFKSPGCTVTSNRGGSTFTVNALVYIPDTHSDNDALGYVRDFKMNYYPDPTTETFTAACEDQPVYHSPPSKLWWGEYLVLHQEEISMETGGEPSAPPAAPEMPNLDDMLAAAESGVNLPSFAMPDVQIGAGFLLENWEITGGETYATKEWIKEDAGLGLVERGTVKLHHRPGG